jgi:hypothetical protein
MDLPVLQLRRMTAVLSVFERLQIQNVHPFLWGHMYARLNLFKDVSDMVDRKGITI